MGCEPKNYTADCQLVRYRLSLIVGALALPCPEARTVSQSPDKPVIINANDQ
ncbi:hypothetical protein H6G33_30945 [Calothrix sp. FACHB-1219]|uniref:hypothetical protein n=1 Tax=unclassified Calothrix TaxID=2619626 RepID=UPI0016828AE5|nr:MULTISPECIES: hypothetical protein [unclassified Calothrix]MBD2206597.1 hypothetical protein [Calothrix sp. FACHB-168]MBD2221392.1 hypothetical protein [Calothrix sp. FACHB-1219]